MRGTHSNESKMSRNLEQWSRPPALPASHYVDTRVYTDHAIFEEEMEKIFGRVWLPVCHESELPEPYDFRASYAGHREYRRLLRAGERQRIAFTAERVVARRLAAGSRLVLRVAIQKRPDRQINFGSGKDVNSESIADAQEPMRVRWHERSHVEIPLARP